jgi:truncated hemoglobin YjbI
MEGIRVARLGGGHPRTRPDHLGGDKAYSSRRNRRYLRRRHIKHTIPEPKDQRAYVFHGTVTVAAIWLWLRP